MPMQSEIIAVSYTHLDVYKRQAYAVLIILVATMTAWIMALLLHLQPVQFPDLSLTLPELSLIHI